MGEAGGFNFTLEVMINKEKGKVLFAEADSHFADMLMSFLTLPLGRIVKVLEKHYGDEAPAVGSLTTLYNILANLDTLHFCSEGAKLTLLNPKSSFELEYEKLKLDIYDSQSAEYFHCTYHQARRFRSVSVYYDHCQACLHNHYNCQMKREVAKKGSGAESSGVFTIHTESFIISNDLRILPNDTGLLGIISILGITDIEKAEPIRVNVGFNEIMSLLKASLTSPTPLSDLILNKTRQMDNSVMVEAERETSLDQIANDEDRSSKKMSLKVMIQKSIGKVLYAQAKEDFVEFLFSFLHIPLGGVEYLLAGKTCNKALDNLYRSASEFIHDEKFMTPKMKNRLIKPNMPHSCVSKNHILPLNEESLPSDYSDLRLFSSDKFPKGQGRYLECSRTYKVMDYLTVTPFCIVSTFSSLNRLKIPMSDIKEVQLQMGLKEGLSILKASLTSSSALTDGLVNHISLRQPKQEP